MLEGITVLNQTEIMDDVQWLVIIITIASAIVALIVGCWLNSLGAAMATWVSSFVLGILIFQPIEPSGRYRYECTIDESVSMTEVYERYEIVEHRGDIWVLEDKE